jgi:RNA polymerase sigma-70 factor (ECF subfamily)
VNSDAITTATTATARLGYDVISRAQHGDSDAFAAIFDAHKAKIYSLCLRMTNNVAEAEDLVQDAFMQVFRKLSSFRGDSALSTWLYRIAVNTVLMHFRKKAPRLLSMDEPRSNPEGFKLAAREHGTRDGRLENSATRLSLIRAISELPEGYRTIFLLHEVEGYEHREIAELLGCSIGNSKSQLHKAKVRMREFLVYSRDAVEPVHSKRQTTRLVERWTLPMPPAPGIDTALPFAHSNA